MTDHLDLGRIEEPTPPYRQVAARLRALIEGGSLPPGEKLPSEKQLQDHYGIGRNAIRSALDVLHKEGLIRPEKAVGWFVAER